MGGIGYKLNIKINQSRDCVFVQFVYLIKWKFGLMKSARSQCSYFILPGYKRVLKLEISFYSQEI